MRGCGTHDDLWPWPLSSRSLRHDFAIKLLKHDTPCHVRSTTCAVLEGFFAYLAQMITSMRGCVLHHDLWFWAISSRSFCHNCELQLLSDGRICCTACTLLDGFFPYLALMITRMKAGVAHNDIWPWPISSRLFCCAYFMDHIHMWHKYNPWGDEVLRTISRSIGQRLRSHRSLIFSWSQRGYPCRSLIYRH